MLGIHRLGRDLDLIHACNLDRRAAPVKRAGPRASTLRARLGRFIVMVMLRPRTLKLLLLLSGVLALPIQAQRTPRRPRLSGDADTNDAVSYFQLGAERLERNPGSAADAFWWAARLDPLSAQVWYGQYQAQLARDPSRYVRYVLREQRALQVPEVLAIDSLRLRAIALDPFFRRGLEEPLLKSYARESTPRDQFMGRGDAISDPEQVAQMERYFRETDPYLAGVFSYTHGELRDAVRYWGNALASHEHDWMWAERGQAFVEMRQMDSARANFTHAIDRARSGTGDEIHHVWETPAAYQVALGRVLEDTRNWAAARDAYQNATAANTAYYPAWLRLGILGLRTGDSAGAVEALKRALELQHDDYFAHVTLGAALGNRGDRDSSLAHLRRATAIEPWASGGWLLLGRALDAANDSTQAVASYQKYLALAPRNDPARLVAVRRIEVLQPTGARP
jgi:tetratricopeptide (TPR) repeat protein